MRDILARIGWSQSTAARHLGVSPATVYLWCKGKPNPIAMKHLEMVARLLGV